MYLAQFVGVVLFIIGASLSIIQGKGISVYVALVIPVRISKDDMLELITAPSSVVFLSKTIVFPARVVNSIIVLSIFCVVVNQKVAACIAVLPDQAGLTP